VTAPRVRETPEALLLRMIAKLVILAHTGYTVLWSIATDTEGQAVKVICGTLGRTLVVTWASLAVVTVAVGAFVRPMRAVGGFTYFTFCLMCAFCLWRSGEPPITWGVLGVLGLGLSATEAARWLERWNP